MVRKRLYRRRSIQLGKAGGLWMGLLMVIVSAAIIALALVFSLLFLALFIIVVIVAVVRVLWMQHRIRGGAEGKIIDVDYEVIERDERRDKGKRNNS